MITFHFKIYKNGKENQLRILLHSIYIFKSMIIMTMPVKNLLNLCRRLIGYHHVSMVRLYGSFRRSYNRGET